MNEDRIEETLAAPQSVVQSAWDGHTLLYYRPFEVAGLGGKLMCVLVVVRADSPFVLTAYFTDRVKKGVLVWPSE